MLVAGYIWNYAVDSANGSYKSDTTGIVYGKIHCRKIDEHDGEVTFLYDAYVLYSVHNVTYRTIVNDKNHTGEAPYFSIGDTITVNYIPDKPQNGIVFHRSKLFRKSYLLHSLGTLLASCVKNPTETRRKDNYP